MDFSRRSFLIGSGVATLPARAASADEHGLRIDMKNGAVRVYLAGSPVWTVPDDAFGRGSTVTHSDRQVCVSNASLAGVPSHKLQFDVYRNATSWMAKLSWIGWPEGQALVSQALDLAAFLSGKAAFSAPLDASKTKEVVANATNAGVAVPSKVTLRLSRRVLPTLLPHASIVEIALSAGHGESFQLPLGVSATDLRLAPRPDRAADAWRAAVVCRRLPASLDLGRSFGATVHLDVPVATQASVVAGERPLRLEGDLRVTVRRGALAEGPLRFEAVDLAETRHELSAEMRPHAGHWTLQTRRALFGVGGLEDDHPITARIESRKGRVRAFDVPVRIYDHGVKVEGAEISRLDFNGTRCRLRLHGMPEPGGAAGMDLALGAPANARLRVPLDDATLWVADPSSLMSLRYRFKAFELTVSASGSAITPTKAAGHEPDDGHLLVVDFKAQHMAEKAYLRQSVPLPDRDIPVRSQTLRAATGAGPNARKARERIAAAKTCDEAMDRGLTGTVEHPFASFSTAWDEAAKDLRRELPWIGPIGLVSSEGRKRAQALAQSRRRTVAQEVAEKLGDLPTDPTALADVFNRAFSTLDLMPLGFDEAGLAATTSGKPDVDAAIDAILAQGEQTNETNRDLQRAWREWALKPPGQPRRFFSKRWPQDLTTQQSVDDAMPQELKGKEPTRVGEAVAARFLRTLLVQIGAGQEEEFERPNEARLSGPSRLAFVVKRPLRLTREDLTDWRDFELRVVRRARRLYKEPPADEAYRASHPSVPRKGRPHVVAVLPGPRQTERAIATILQYQGVPFANADYGELLAAIAANDLMRPGPFDTAVEASERLILSPAQDASWTTPRAAPPHVAEMLRPETTVPVWQTELSEADPQTPSLRAVWSRDFSADALFDRARHPAPPAGPWAPWALPSSGDPPTVRFRAAVDARDRHELVGLTAVWGLPARARRDAQGVLHSSQAALPAGFMTSRDPAGDVALYMPRALSARRLAMSSLGASLDLETTFTPPASPQIGGRDIYDTFSLSRFSIQTSYGYDEVVEVVRKGFLFPSGHQAAFVRTTRREICGTVFGPVAYPVQRVSVQVPLAEKAYGLTGQRDGGRRMAARKIELLTTRTPDLLDPTSGVRPAAIAGQDPQPAANGVMSGSTGSGGLAGLVFWPRTEPGQAGDVRFRMKIDDGADSVYMPLVFLDNQAAHDAPTVRALVERFYNRPEEGPSPQPFSLARFNVVQHGGASRSYAAQDRPGDTSYATDWQEIGVEGRDAGADGAQTDAPFSFDPVLESLDQPPFFPFLRQAQIRPSQVGQLTGEAPPPTRVRFDPEYLAHGFDGESEGGPPFTFLVVEGDRPRVDMGRNGDRAGGAGRPSYDIVGFSRRVGPVGGKPAAAPTRRADGAHPRARFAMLQQTLSDATVSVGSAVAPRAPEDFFDDNATLLGLFKLNALVKTLAAFAMAEGNKALPLLQEVTQFAEGAAGGAIEAADQVVAAVESAYDRANGEAVGYGALGARLKEMRSALGNAKAAPLDGISRAWSAGQHLAAELDNLAKAPLAPASDAVLGRLRAVQSEWSSALSSLAPHDAVRKAAASFLATLAGGDTWGPAILGVDGLPALAGPAADAVRTAAGNPAVWLEPDPPKAILAAAGAALGQTIRIEARDLEGFLYQDFAALVSAVATGVDAGFENQVSALRRSLLPVIAKIEVEYGNLAASANALCVSGSSAMRTWVATTVPDMAPLLQLAADTSDAAAALKGLSKKLSDAVKDLPEATRNVAAPLIAWSEHGKAPIAAATARIGAAVVQLATARADVLASLGGPACLDPHGFAKKAERLERLRSELAAACLGWAASLPDAPPAVFDASTDDIVAEAVTALRRGTAAATGLVKGSSIAATLDASGASATVQAYVQAVAIAANATNGLPEPAAVLDAANVLAAVARQATKQADDAVTSLQTAVEDARHLAQAMAKARDDLEKLARDLVAQALRAAFAKAAAEVVEPLKAVVAGASDATTAIYRRIVAARLAAFRALKDQAALDSILGGAPSGTCGPGWGAALLLVPAASGAGTCTVEEDELTREAAEVSTATGFASALARWEMQPPAPVVLVRRIERTAEIGLRAAVTRLLDVEGLRRQLVDALGRLVPLSRKLTYAMTLPLDHLPDFAFLKLSVPSGGALVLSSVTTVSLNPLSAQPALESRFSGKLPTCTLDIPEVLTISLDPIEYSGGSGQPGKLDAKVQKVILGDAVSFLKKLGDLLGKGGQGPYVLLRQDRPAIEAGYLLSIGAVTIGTLAILNINLAAACILPFDGSDARFSFSLGTIDQPFLLSAAPYGGGGFFGIEAGAGGITATSASFEYGGVAAVAYGPLEGVGRITTGVYIRQAGGAAELTGLFFAGFSGHVACFGIAASFTLRLRQDASGLSGEAILRFSFSFGLGHIDYQVRVSRKMDNNFGKTAELLDDSRAATRFASKEPSGYRPRRARITTLGVCAVSDWIGHEAYFDDSLRPVEAMP